MNYGEGIISRLHENCSLRDPNNPVRPIIINTIGAWLDNHDPTELMNGVYLQSATGKYLDLFGKDFDIPRKLDESDEHYRNRLFYQALGYLTVDYLVNVYDLHLYVYVEDFDTDDNTLTSDNQYINSAGFMADTDDETQNILEKTFVLGSSITWL